MNTFASIIASAAVTFTFNASTLMTASAAAYDPASAYVSQFSGAKVHIENVDRSLRNPAQDYIDAAHSTFRAEKRNGGKASVYDASADYINRIY